MSLVSTLGRIAMGIAVAKGVGKMVNRGGASNAGAGGLGGLLGSVLGGQKGPTGGIGDVLGSVLGGGNKGGGGLGDLGALLGGGSASAGQSGSLPGGLGGLLESMAGGGSGSSTSAPAGGSLGDLLNSALQGKKTPEPAPAQEDQARILIRAMINAAKSDGEIDKAEQEKIVSNLGEEVSEEERQFVVNEMRSPLDLDDLVKNIPRGAEMQVYMMSLLGIDLDSQKEAQYLDSLRKSIGMNEQQANAVHKKLGVPTLYS